MDHLGRNLLSENKIDKKKLTMENNADYIMNEVNSYIGKKQRRIFFDHNQNEKNKNNETKDKINDNNDFSTLSETNKGKKGFKKKYIYNNDENLKENAQNQLLQCTCSQNSPLQNNELKCTCNQNIVYAQCTCGQGMQGLNTELKCTCGQMEQKIVSNQSQQKCTCGQAKCTCGLSSGISIQKNIEIKNTTTSSSNNNNASSRMQKISVESSQNKSAINT